MGLRLLKTRRIGRREFQIYLLVFFYKVAVVYNKRGSILQGVILWRQLLPGILFFESNRHNLLPKGDENGAHHLF